MGPSWITVVGDSDQSIYAFRGADIRNIQDFEQDFPNAKTIMLEQNYRSTQTILDAANAVIAKNENRKPKKLWTALGQGDKIVGYAADNAQQEAGWIANEIARIHTEEDVAYRDIAIMYRANAQSRSLEEATINANLPYQLVGGTKFYERREVKDAIAYLQAIVNPADNVNVRRILNVPKRGLGARAEGLVAGYADAHGLTFFESIEHMDQIEGMTGRTTKPLGAFRDRCTSWPISPRNMIRNHPKWWPKYWIKAVFWRNCNVPMIRRMLRVWTIFPSCSPWPPNSNRTRRMPRWPVFWRPRHWSPTPDQLPERARIPARSR